MRIMTVFVWVVLWKWMVYLPSLELRFPFKWFRTEAASNFVFLAMWSHAPFGLFEHGRKRAPELECLWWRSRRLPSSSWSHYGLQRPLKLVWHGAVSFGFIVYIVAWSVLASKPALLPDLSACFPKDPRCCILPTKSYTKCMISRWQCELFLFCTDTKDKLNSRPFRSMYVHESRWVLYNWAVSVCG